MANHKSAIKRIRSNDAKRVRNRYYHRTTRNAVKAIRTSNNKKEALGLVSAVFSMLDKLAKRNVIHKNKAANIKSSIHHHVNALA
ncbi:MAG TPA: 30S ribosomal protein S20 [Flavobacteriales bacterium]|nr:30S ribosomal protein S20 [Flavobacteriales bacterium]HCA83603.1 30S ribosomal protein S20 [Flavobacteriales bacterium]HRE73317.1 30S ribosomal protein S20 [Flavobacteriales bacterium]HRE98168.1 30S ribosomal protein S20 [Flavobacteriales bacterium]HRJ35639.1 30S ribosomal protein S20 [Flavobacteriales bacterium]